MEEKLINVGKLKAIFREIFNTFERHKLNRAEIEFVIAELNNVSKSHSKKVEIEL